MILDGGPIGSMPIDGSEPSPIGGNPAARTAARIAADWDQYKNTPFPLGDLPPNSLRHRCSLCTLQGTDVFGSSKTATTYY
jgi:hypothetical protein